MRSCGHGDAGKLATGVSRAVARTKTPAPSSPLAPAAPPSIDIDTAAIEQALGHKGKVNGGVLQGGVARAETSSEGGMQLPGSLGLATALHFQPTASAQARLPDAL